MIFQPPLAVHVAQDIKIFLIEGEAYSRLRAEVVPGCVRPHQCDISDNIDFLLLVFINVELEQ